MYPASRPAKLPGRQRCAEANLVLEGHETFYALYEPISSCKVQSLSDLVSIAREIDEDEITFVGRRTLRFHAYGTGTL